MHKTPQSPSRRQFLQAAVAAPFILPAARAATAPSERITIGVIGIGGRSSELLSGFLASDDTQVVAVCDVHELHYRDRAWGDGSALGREGGRQRVEAYYSSKAKNAKHSGVGVYADYRDICGRDDIDAVVVVTPDHWHAACTLDALRAGKDVYCEKPVTHFFHEGLHVCEAVKRHDAVFQAGSQQRSSNRFRHAAELVRNGHLGKVTHVEVGLPEGYAEPMGDPAITDPPEGLDYEAWCGPAPVLPYTRARHHRWWRGHRAYGGGVLMDWIGHHNDIAHWGLGVDHSGPTRIEVIEWTHPQTDLYNTPQHYTIACTYAGGVTSTISSRHRLGTKWIGEDGWVYVDRGVIEASDPRWVKPDFDTGATKLYASTNHIANFIDGVKTRTPCIAPAETAHRSITPGHLAWAAQELGRAIDWDPAAQTSPDEELQTLLNPPPRAR